MEVLEIQTKNSWSSDDSPLILGDIVAADKSVAIWKREKNHIVSDYFKGVFPSLGLGIKGVFTIENMEQALDEDLPDYEGKSEAIKDIFLLADMLTCLFDCDSVGLRLVPLKSAMCPKFHTDNIPVRLVHTYLGEGTQWLPNESMHDKPPLALKGKLSKTNFSKFYQKEHIHQMKSFDVALLKGSAWPGQENMAAAHRSCPVEPHELRLLLTLDPM